MLRGLDLHVLSLSLTVPSALNSPPGIPELPAGGGEFWNLLFVLRFDGSVRIEQRQRRQNDDVIPLGRVAFGEYCHLSGDHAAGLGMR